MNNSFEEYILTSEEEEELAMLKMVNEEAMKFLPTYSVDVTDLENSTTEEDLVHHFEECGDILQIHHGLNAFSLEFRSKEAFDAAMALNRTTLKGRQIKVSPNWKNEHEGSLKPHRRKPLSRSRKPGPYGPRGKIIYKLLQKRFRI